MVLANGCHRSVGFLGFLLDRKSKSPLFPGAGGELWLQMTGALIGDFTLTLSYEIYET